MELRIKKLHPDAILPVYASAGAACFDLHACLPDNDAAISTMKHPTVTVDTGIAFEVPPGWVMLVYSRSGHGFKENTRLANCVGVVDSDYRGAVRVKLTRDGGGMLFFRHGDRIAQAMLVQVPQVSLVEVDDLSETERGEGGFGSTGTGLLEGVSGEESPKGTQARIATPEEVSTFAAAREALDQFDGQHDAAKGSTPAEVPTPDKLIEAERNVGASDE